MSRLTGQPNTYVLEGETRERMEEIDRKLRDHNPAAQNNMSLIPTSDSPFILPTEENSAKKRKKGMMDSQSNFSQLEGMSNISRRSNLTLLTL